MIVETRKKLLKQVLVFLLCSVMVLGILPVRIFSNENPLVLPLSVSLTTMDGAVFVPGQELMPDEGFRITYKYGTIESIDASVKYALPMLSNHIQVSAVPSEGNIATIPVLNENSQFLGTLVVNKLDGSMTFQFDEAYNAQTMDDFFLMFAVRLDKDTVSAGDNIDLSFPIQGGTANFPITVVDTEKEPPEIEKAGTLSSDASNSGSSEILWTVTVKHAGNPHESVSIRDTWSENQEYVDGSFRIDGTPVTAGLSLESDGKGLSYERTGITPNAVDIITYKTRIKSSAFLNNSLPIGNGNIKCTNSAQAFLPGGSDVALNDKVTASYTHPIQWLYKTSGNVIDRTTGEMEWTITIYNNGLSMQDVILYDRLSPGVSIKGNTATMQIGNGPVQTLDNFMRTSDSDITYASDSNLKYNLLYPLGSIGNTAVIKYRTIITNMSEYDAGAHIPPDSIFDNLAFISYRIPSGAGLSSVITSPVVEKSGGYDTGLIGKEGKIEPEYHTINWKINVNDNGDTLKGVTVTDMLTYADPISKLPSAERLCKHVYDDSILRNKPQYSFDGVNFTDFSTYDADNPDTPFTYRLVPTGTEVYKIIFYVGDLSQKLTITFRSTVTDEIIYANNVTGSKCRYENKATLVTTGNLFSYAVADVAYNSNVFQKQDARSWFNKSEHTYNFEDNQLVWVMHVNTNKMEMTDICITDTLNEGTGLVEGAIILGSGSGPWYKLREKADTVKIPKYTDGAAKPYYTYDDSTREFKIYLADITGNVVGTDDAMKQVVFYVQVDVNHPIFNDPTYPGYIANSKGVWPIPNTGSMESNYLSGDAAVKESAIYTVFVQHLSKDGTAYKNDSNYSIDYSIAINRIQRELPEFTVIQDLLPAGLRLDSSTLRIYEATAISPELFYVMDDGTNGKLVKGAEIDPLLYKLSTAVNSDGTTTMRITLPQNSGSKMYIAEYSCDVIDISKAPFTNSALMEGVVHSSTDHTTTSIVLTSAAGGGTLREVEKTTVYVTKTNSVSNIPVVGAVFGLYHNGILLEKKSTDSNGRLSFENISKKYTYTIKELEAASGYLEPINVEQTFVATGAENPTRLSFVNYPITGTVQFTKTDEAGNALPGAEFGIWANYSDIGTNAPLETAISGSNGVVSFTSLTAGSTYYIAEISAPEGFRKSEEVIVARMGTDGAMEKLWLKNDAGATAITSFANPPITGTVQFTKTDDAGNALPGAEFGIWANSSEVGINTPLATAISSSNGVVSFSPLTAGSTYYIAEISAPESYRKSDEVIVAQISANGTTEKLWLQSDTGATAITSFANVPITGTVQFTKTDEAGNALPGAEFGIWANYSDIGTNAPLETAISGSNGVVSFSPLTAGSTYYIAEISAPEGFRKSDEVIVAQISANGTTEKLWLQSDTGATAITSFANVPITGTVQFTKTDEAGKALSGAKFGIWANSSDIGTNAPLETAISGSNGVVSFTSLTAGSTYYIAEISAPESYRKSDEVIVAQISANGTTEKLWLQSDTGATAITSFVNVFVPQITDPTYTSLSVNKFWSDNNSPYRPKGVSVQLYRDGEAYEIVTLNAENGWSTTWNRLDDRYAWTVEEINVPAGYASNVLKNGTQWTITNKMITAVTVDITGTKTLTGGGKTSADIADGQFTFRVTSDSNNNVSGFTGLNTEVSVKPGGKIDFATLTFSKTGTYRFAITENDLGMTGYTYDKSSFKVDIVVTANERTNKLEAAVTMTKLGDSAKEGETVSAISFINSYEITDDSDNPDLPDTGDNGSMEFWFAVPVIISVSLFGCGCYDLTGRKKSKSE